MEIVFKNVDAFRDKSYFRNEHPFLHFLKCLSLNEKVTAVEVVGETNLWNKVSKNQQSVSFRRFCPAEMTLRRFFAACFLRRYFFNFVDWVYEEQTGKQLKAEAARQEECRRAVYASKVEK